jgi:alpha-beta hydrolase superfamily lysophospholipase
MQYKEDQFTCADGDQLFFRKWIPHEAPLAILIIIHGFSDHSGRYQSIADNLVPRRIAIYSFDQRGHGRSPGQRGHIDSFSAFREDALIFTRLVASQEPDIPLFLFGQSMGGLIVLDFGLHHPQEIHGVIASSPHLSDPPVSPILITMSRALSNVWPTFSMDAGIDNSGLSRDPDIVKTFLDDPLCHGKGTPRLATELSKAVVETNANAAGFQPPLLITHGTADRMTDPEASRRFYEKVNSPNKKYIAYEGGYHEGHNDIHRERVIIDIAQWLEEQIRVITQQPENSE